MPSLDLSLNNPKILSYLKGESDSPPIGELLYVHTHFIKNNFLSEIEIMINLANQELLLNSRKKGVGIRISSLAEKLAEQVNSINEESAPLILQTLREIYKACSALIYSTNSKTNHEIQT